MMWKIYLNNTVISVKPDHLKSNISDSHLHAEGEGFIINGTSYQESHESPLSNSIFLLVEQDFWFNPGLNILHLIAILILHYSDTLKCTLSGIPLTLLTHWHKNFFFLGCLELFFDTAAVVNIKPKSNIFNAWFNLFLVQFHKLRLIHLAAGKGNIENTISSILGIKV